MEGFSSYLNAQTSRMRVETNVIRALVSIPVEMTVNEVKRKICVRGNQNSKEDQASKQTKRDATILTIPPSFFCSEFLQTKIKGLK